MYHYTDITALTNIVENNELWLTHIDYLNDHTEGQELYKILCGIFKDEPNIIKLLDFVDRTNEAYCLSFSTEPNLLSQWRGYCPSTGGYNIGFIDNIFQLPFEIFDKDDKRAEYPDDKYSFDENALSYSISNQKCIYLEEDKNEFSIHLSKILRKAYEYMIELNSSLIFKFCNSGISSLNKEELVELNNLLQRNSGWYQNYGSGKYTVKNIAFKEESEIRVFIIPNKGSFNPFYRIKKNVPIPYLKIKFNCEFLKKITIGPCENYKLAKRGLEHFLLNNTQHGENDLTSVIVDSSTPYRNL